MSITVLSYHDQTLINQVNAAALERQKAREAKYASTAEASADFSSVLNNASGISGTQTAAYSECPSDLYNIFAEAAATFQVPVNLLTSIARAESGFDTTAVSSAGAVGIMQLMPATAASLGVTNSYDARENIMGGAKLIAQLLNKYNGNTALALAAYNAGSANVDNYGGIPPFTETQNYVRKVLSYLNTENQTAQKDALSELLSARGIHEDTLAALADLLKTLRTEDTDTSASADAAAQSSAAAPAITVTVLPEPPIV